MKLIRANVLFLIFTTIFNLNISFASSSPEEETKISSFDALYCRLESPITLPISNEPVHSFAIAFADYRVDENLLPRLRIYGPGGRLGGTIATITSGEYIEVNSVDQRRLVERIPLINRFFFDTPNKLLNATVSFDYKKTKIYVYVEKNEGEDRFSSRNYGGYISKAGGESVELLGCSQSSFHRYIPF